jgi:murein DD-endopeptidase MepM/ murein hydrolase activator NlpD
MTAAPIFARLVPPALKAAGGAVAPPPSPTPASATPAAAPAASTPVPEAGAARQADASVMPPDIAYDATATPFYQNGAACVAEEAPLIGSGSFVWPSRYQNLTGGAFAEQHPGIDLGAPQGSAVRAADAGMVVFSGWSGLGYGNVVVIDHGNGFWTLYAHLSQVAVPCGTPVKQNQRIGSAGATGDVSGEHLHFEVRVAGGWIDPLKVLPKP